MLQVWRPAANALALPLAIWRWSLTICRRILSKALYLATLEANTAAVAWNVRIVRPISAVAIRAVLFYDLQF